MLQPCVEHGVPLTHIALQHGIALRTRIVSAQISGNVVQQVGGDGITMSEGATAEELAIERTGAIAKELIASPVRASKARRSNTGDVGARPDVGSRNAE